MKLTAGGCWPHPVLRLCSQFGSWVLLGLGRGQALSKHRNDVFLESLYNTLAPQAPCLGVLKGSYHEVAFAWPSRETELHPQANLRGNMTPFDPTGWQGLGNVSLHSFILFLRRFLCLQFTQQSACWEWQFCFCFLWPSLPLRCMLVLEVASEPWLPHDTKLFPANGSHRARLFHSTFLNTFQTVPTHPTADGGKLAITGNQG